MRRNMLRVWNPESTALLLRMPISARLCSPISRWRECQTGDCYLATPVITPNGDGFNDYFDFSCLRDFPSTQLDVYDRWGRKVFSMQDYDGSWDGMGTDGELVEGSYMWVLIATLDNGDERVYKGTLSILR
jgi:gliding motility-associated-like protein